MSGKFAASTPSAELHRQSGMAVIMVLLILVLVVGLATKVLRDYGTAVESISGYHDQAEARQLALGAIDWASSILADDARTSATDHLGEPWATHLPPIQVEEGEVNGDIQDVSGRFDLNSLTKNGIVDQVQSDTYQRLLHELGIPADQTSALAASLQDWIDSDDTPTSSDGAESAWYAAQTPPRAPANGPLVDIDELRLVRGYDIALVARLRPFVAALPAPTTINVNTASAEVLAAVLPKLTLDETRALVAQRQKVPFRNLGDISGYLARNDIELDPKRLGVTSRYFLVSGYARYAQAITHIQVLLDRNSRWPTVIWRKIW